MAGVLLMCFAMLNAALPQNPVPTFGTTVVGSSGLRGNIYDLKPGTDHLPNFKKLKPLGTIYTTSLNIPPQPFTLGFPGVTQRFEWFAIDYSGRIWIDSPGAYKFALTSDDGSKFYIDHRTIIDNDGIHPPETVIKTVTLKTGVHEIRVSYFQGPRYQVALMLYVSRPGDTTFRAFDTNDFKPPPDADLTDLERNSAHAKH
ncbi:MAG: hypothetical protein JOZ62_13750 [Acidobacteriaceae bacterium]|nr:hypothetical protein [Acidobacteriaceae bacterium]